jgi:hypothetical protein
MSDMSYSFVYRDGRILEKIDDRRRLDHGTQKDILVLENLSTTKLVEIIGITREMNLISHFNLLFFWITIH